MSERSSEAILLLLLARGTVAAGIEEQVRSLLRQDLAWDLVVADAKAQGVLPLLTRNLSRLGFPGVPAKVRAELEAAYQRNALRNALLARELSRLLELFGSAGVPVIPLKGVALAESLYGDPGLRVCSDLDVLVPRHLVREAFGLLLAHGYEREDRYPVQLGDVDFLVRNSMEYGFRSSPPAFPYLLELHWDIAWRWRADAAMVDDIWADARPQVFDGVQVLAMSAEWELLYLAVHASRHRWQGVKWLADINEVCLRGRVDWDIVTNTARRFGLEGALQITLSACETLFGTPVPPGYDGHQLPSWLSLFPSPAPPMGKWRRALLVRRLFRRPQDRLRYVARLLFKPTLGELELLRLPFWLRTAYYPLRLARLAIASARVVSRPP